MGILDIFKKKEEAHVLVTENFSVAGVGYYKNNIDKLSSISSEWNGSAVIGKNIYKYTYVNKPVKLVPEPSNKHDKNAIQVLIAGELVGYIGADQNKHVSDVLKHRDVKYITAFISGGPYKIVSGSGKTEKGEKAISVNVRIAHS